MNVFGVGDWWLDVFLNSLYVLYCFVNQCSIDLVFDIWCFVVIVILRGVVLCCFVPLFVCIFSDCVTSENTFIVFVVSISYDFFWYSFLNECIWGSWLVIESLLIVCMYFISKSDIWCFVLSVYFFSSLNCVRKWLICFCCFSISHDFWW